MAAVGDGVAGEGAYEGLVIAGRYRLVRRLGAGGFGQVWQATDTALHVDVAVKQVWLAPSMSPAQADERLVRAQREARSAARLRDHPHVVAVHDVLVADGVPWTVMQLITGGSLADRLAADGPLAPETVARIGAAVLSALGAAHAAGIVHRDVKPANIMLADDGQVLLTDFGIALRHEDTALTATGAVIGSIEYMAPERIHGQDDGPAGDLFSLGVSLYQAVEGLSPFQRATPTASLLAVVSDEAPPARRAGALAPVIEGLMTKDPLRRLSFHEAAALLGRAAAAPVPGSADPAVPAVPAAGVPVPVPAAPAPAPSPGPAAFVTGPVAPAPVPAAGSTGAPGVIDAYAGPTVPAQSVTGPTLPVPPAAGPTLPAVVPAAVPAPHVTVPEVSAADPSDPADPADTTDSAGRPRRRTWPVITASLLAGAAALGVAFAVPYFSETSTIRAKLLHKSDMPSGYYENSGAGDMGYGRPVGGTWPCEARNRETRWKHTQDDTAEFFYKSAAGAAERYSFNEQLKEADAAEVARTMQSVRDQLSGCPSFTAKIKFSGDPQSCEVTVKPLPAPAIGGDVVARRETYTCTENGITYAPAVVDKVTTAKGGYLVEFFATESRPFPPAGQVEALMTKALGKLP
ncbi:serine/threonine protein kinase [Kitasatospora sp. RG8]|uniref:serine/threonine-protein kinase n=1 Tax=Kitasatospora sp. RG8 TaxID=2820815 RepID=UPI001ADFBAC4|nr:serine/threonine-protein kinase [Kitasatospora sp. RG8]MBP0450864.1 serine/threonine protein kinase [Kitasatospora sp. RG8]